MSFDITPVVHIERDDARNVRSIDTPSAAIYIRLRIANLIQKCHGTAFMKAISKLFLSLFVALIVLGVTGSAIAVPNLEGDTYVNNQNKIRFTVDQSGNDIRSNFDNKDGSINHKLTASWDDKQQAFIGHVVRTVKGTNCVVVLDLKIVQKESGLLQVDMDNKGPADCAVPSGYHESYEWKKV